MLEQFTNPRMVALVITGVFFLILIIVFLKLGKQKSSTKYVSILLHDDDINFLKKQILKKEEEYELLTLGNEKPPHTKEFYEGQLALLENLEETIKPLPKSDILRTVR